MSLKLAVWDVDGTLVDSRAAIFAAVKVGFAAMGLPEPTYDAVRQIVGLSLRDAMAAMVPELEPVALTRLVDGYKQAFQDFHRDPDFIEPLYDGAAETLDRLKASGWRIALATGKSRRGVDTIVRMHGWTGFFDSAHCSDDGPGKPHPAMLIAAMRASGAAPRQTIMIGDTSHDMRMARARARAPRASAGASIPAPRSRPAARTTSPTISPS
jgi:phosphoglycolate phosphatase